MRISIAAVALLLLAGCQSLDRGGYGLPDDDPPGGPADPPASAGGSAGPPGGSSSGRP